MVQRILALKTVTLHLQRIFNVEITTIHNGVTLPKSHTLRSAILLDSAARMRTARALELSTQLRVTFMVIFLVILWEVPGIPASKMVILWWKYSMHTVSGTFCQTGTYGTQQKMDIDNPFSRHVNSLDISYLDIFGGFNKPSTAKATGSNKGETWASNLIHHCIVTLLTSEWQARK